MIILKIGEFMSALSASASAAADFDAKRFFGPNLAANCGLDFIARPAAASRPIWLLRQGAAQPQSLPAAAPSWLAEQNFTAKAGAFALLPGAANGSIGGAVFGLGAANNAAAAADCAPFSRPQEGESGPHIFGLLPALLPTGSWHFAAESIKAAGLSAADLTAACLAMLAAAYRFSLKTEAAPAALRRQFALPAGVDKAALLRQAEALFFTRNLINLPANIMDCNRLEAAARYIAEQFKAGIAVISGAELARDFPLIQAVGRAGAQAPRLIALSWDNCPGAGGGKAGPAVSLVSKGVCFDTGGLDIKSAAGMGLMKKDMGGAANALGLAQLIMAAGLPLHLRVFIPAVENSISGNAFRPGDVLPSRKGLSVEIGNTDAEGRLILADALARADEDAPDILLDMATLTGAARVALGPDMPPFYCRSGSFAAALLAAAQAQHDPLWPMPLWQPYLANMASPIADLNNAGKDGMAGSITAALFLSRFVERAKIWAHLDIYGWRPKAAFGCPAGGRAQGIFALFALLQEKFGQ